MSSVLNILAMNVTMDDNDYIRELNTRQEIPPRRELEIKIEAAQLAIARLQETPFQNSLEQKKERLNQLYREYADSFGVG